MKSIRVYNAIANDAQSEWLCGGGEVFSLASLRDIVDNLPEGESVRLEINCVGGATDEGFAIYDYLRTSGREIFTNIDGMCHSMAIVLLLSAPKENRSANPNARALIHNVYGGAYGTARDIARQADLIKAEQMKIARVYADRCGMSVDDALNLMSREEEHSVEELLEMGFISSINTYNTNFYNKMKKNFRKGNAIANFLNKSGKMLGLIINYDFYTAEGDLLFSTDREDDTLEAGVKITSDTEDGEYTLLDGRVVVIKDKEVVEVKEFDAGEATQEELAEHIEELEKENDELKKEVEELTNLMKEAREMIANLSKEVKSNYQPAKRVNLQKKAVGMTSEERKQIIRNNLSNKKK